MTKIPMFLECREPDGTVVFYAIEKVMQSPDLQRRCIQKRRLRRIRAELQQRLAEDMATLAKSMACLEAVLSDLA